MHLQVVTRNAGIGVCPACSQTSQRLQVSLQISGDDVEELTRAIKVCLECAQRPGVCFDTDAKSVSKHSGVGLYRIKKASNREEAKAARHIGGKTTKASGATNQDGDAVSEHWMVEQKMSGAKSLTISESTILKAAAQAAKYGRTWVLRLMLPKLNLDVAVLPWYSAIGAIKAWDRER